MFRGDGLDRAAIAIVEQMERLQWSEGLSVWFYLGLVLIVQDGLPRCVGVEALHLFELLECIWAEVLLVDDAVVADHEGLHTGDAYWAGEATSAKPLIIKPSIT